MNILFLYTELAEYTLACLKALKESREDVNIAVIHYPVNKEAPFQFDFSGIGKFININDFPSHSSILSFVESFNPSKIVVSGWKVKQYIKVCRHFRKKSVIILTMDNHYVGSLKQKIFRLIFPFTFSSIFKYCWVPGEPQKKYALKLGFKDENIEKGFYCCSLTKFNKFYQGNLQLKTLKYPRIFLCVARYVSQKNYELLWNAFIEWQDKSPNEWELWCAGTGENFDKKINHAKIKHLGFIQGDEWAKIISSTGVFVLPSLFEPWGVVVHEFAAAGFPLLLSNCVGASTQFLSTTNGISFNPNSKEEIIKGLEYFRGCNNIEMLQMSKKSYKISQSINLQSWAETVLYKFA